MCMIINVLRRRAWIRCPSLGMQGVLKRRSRPSVLIELKTNKKEKIIHDKWANGKKLCKLSRMSYNKEPTTRICIRPSKYYIEK